MRSFVDWIFSREALKFGKNNQQNVQNYVKKKSLDHGKKRKAYVYSGV